MKKIIVSAALVLACAITLTSCGKTEATKDVIALIKEIGQVTDDSADILAQIKQSYDALSEQEKEKVKNYDKYEKALEEYNEIITFNEDTDRIVAAASTDLSYGESSYTELVSRGKEILAAYDEMNDDRRASVTENISKLSAAVAVLENYRENALVCAKAYLNAFNEVFKDAGYGEVTQIGCLSQVWNGKQYMFFALTVGTGENEKSFYSQARFADPAIYTAMTAEENRDIFFASKPTSEESDALAAGNIAMTVEEVMAAGDTLPEPVTMTEQTTVVEETPVPTADAEQTQSAG